MAIPKRITTPFDNIPGYFRIDIYSKIFESVEKYGNLQLIGLWGFGKSLTLRLLESNQENIKKELKNDTNAQVFLSDLSLIADKSTNSVLRHIFAKVLGLSKLQSVNNIDLAEEIQKFFDDARKEGRRVILILDSMEKLSSRENMEVFDFLHALYKQNIYFLSFIFCFEREVEPETVKSEFGELGRLMFGKVLYISPLNSVEQDWFFDAQAAMIPDANISEKTKKLILDRSGGYMVSIKRLIEAAAAGEDVNEVIEDPNSLPGLAYNLEILLSGLGKYLETLEKVMNRNISESDRDGIRILQKHYLIDENNEFLSKLLLNYLKKKLGKKVDYREEIGDIRISAKLTSGEYKIIKFLSSNKGTVCTRDEIIDAVWGEKATNGIADHALDQIMSRLRKKLVGSGVKIETLRGRGHRLVS